MSEKFTVRYQATDSRPQSFSISADDIDSGMSENQLEALYYDLLDEDFRMKISPDADAGNMEEFIAWAKARMEDK
jgi:hypothetical protein